MPKQTIYNLANTARAHFEQKERGQGDDKETIWVKTADAPHWVESLVYTVHQETIGGLPDDYTYEYIVEALEAITEHAHWNDDEYEVRESVMDSNPFEGSSYYADVTDWLESNWGRVEYANDALKNYGADLGVMGAAQVGQQLEKEAVFQAVVDFLAETVEEMNERADDLLGVSEEDEEDA